jgi:hypothetical protein
MIQLSENIIHELSEAELTHACGGGMRDYFQQAASTAIKGAEATITHGNALLCSPDTALMNTNGSLTSSSAGCIW